MPNPRRLALLALLAPLALPAQEPARITTEVKDSVVKGVLDALDRGYVFPAKAAEVRKSITARHASGAYAGIENGGEFAIALTRDLQDVTHDKHLRVRYAAQGAPTPPSGGPGAGGIAEAARSQGYGIGKVEVLDGNIGYLEIRSFGFPPQAIDSAVAAAMTTIAGTRALIVDVRQNGGGSPHAVALYSSYLFGEEPVHLNSLYFRPSDRTDHFYTQRTVRGRRFGPDKPVYVLTSQRTFSAAEEFTYNLQSLKRATIVGETTGGGAHPGGVQLVTRHFGVFVPQGRAINPITKTNWEGTGVRPEIPVPADSALEAALKALRARAKVATSTN